MNKEVKRFVSDIAPDRSDNHELYKKCLKGVQYNSYYYDTLKERGLLFKFLEIITECSLKHRSKKATVQILNEYFSEQFEYRQMTMNTFDKILARYRDVKEAWSAGSATANATAWMLKEQLFKLALEGKLDPEYVMDLMKYCDQGAIRKQSSPDYVQKKEISSTSQEVKFRGDSRETVETINSVEAMVKERYERE